MIAVEVLDIVLVIAAFFAISTGLFAIVVGLVLASAVLLARLIAGGAQ